MSASSPPLRLWASILAVAGVQTAILGWMVWDRVTLLDRGREVVIDVVPVDPRSLFRGDYVRFNYDFSRIPTEIVAERPERGRPVWVLIEKGEGDKWKAVKASGKPLAGADDRHVLLKGHVEGWFSGHLKSTFPIPIRYGIESFFVPEGEGLDLEKLVREKRISVLLAVRDDGTSAIKGIMADGKPIMRENRL